MKYLVFVSFLMFAAQSFAQGVKKGDLVGKWQMSKMFNKGTAVFDASNPKVAEASAMKNMKKQNPKATKDDEAKVMGQMKMMQDAFSKMYYTFNADGTYENANMNTVMDPNGTPKKGTYSLEEATSTLKCSSEGSGEEKSKIKIVKGVLTMEVPEMSMSIEFKKG